MRTISNLILLAFILCVILVSVEYGARFVLSGQYENHKFSMLPYYKAVESYSKNTRDRIPTDLKSDQAVVVFIGDSFTYGQAVEEGETYPEFYSRCTIRRGKDIKVLNLGIESTDILDQTAYIKSIINTDLAGMNVVAIVQGLTQNDRYIKGNALHPYEVCSQDYPLSAIRMLQNHSFIATYLESLVVKKSHFDGKKMVIDPKTENCLRRNFDELTNLVADKNIKLVRTYLYDSENRTSSIDDMKPEVDEHFESFQRDYPSNYIVLNEAFSTKESFNELYGADNYHFNSVTNALIGEYLCDQIDI